MTIRVLSFDFDGCLFNKAYIDAHDKDIIKYNREMLELIKASNSLFTKNMIFVGSNRQSYTIDQYNASLSSRGSCYPAIQKLSDFLNEGSAIPTVLDKFLLADVFGDKIEGEISWKQRRTLADGTSFERATNPHYLGPHPEYLNDANKLIIIYAQMHKIASEHPDELIQFDFYDDQENILRALESFFETYTIFIPDGMTLRLHQYDASQPSRNIAEIAGTGRRDEAFRETIKMMANITFKESGAYSFEDCIIDTTKHVTPDKLIDEAACYSDVCPMATNPMALFKLPDDFDRDGSLVFCI